MEIYLTRKELITMINTLLIIQIIPIKPIQCSNLKFWLIQNLVLKKFRELVIHLKIKLWTKIESFITMMSGQKQFLKMN